MLQLTPSKTPNRKVLRKTQDHNKRKDSPTPLNDLSKKQKIESCSDHAEYDLSEEEREHQIREAFKDFHLEVNDEDLNEIFNHCYLELEDEEEIDENRQEIDPFL